MHRSARRILTVLAALLATPAWPAQWIVDDDGPADFRTIQSAVDAVYVHSGDVLLVRPGTYAGNVVLTSKDLVIRSEQGPLVTILDAQGGGSVVSLQDRTSLTRVEGFTIRNGRDQTGGGVWIYGGGPVITRNIIEGNQAVGGFLGYGYGGGIEVYASAAVITRNVIRGNAALDGGGGIDVYYAGPSTPGTCCPLIAQNTIVDNHVTSTTGTGGGVLSSGAEPTLSSCIVAGNQAASGGGLFVEKIQGVNDSPDVVSNVFHANTAGDAASNASWRLPSSNQLADPLLGEGEGLALWPRSHSPALDAAAAGLPTGPDLMGWPGSIDSDLDGVARGDAGALENRAEITGLSVAVAAGGAAALTFDLAPGSAHFHVYADTLPFRTEGGLCLSGSIASPAYTDSAPLAPGQIRFYLVAGHGAVEGARGYHTDGSAVPATSSCN
jgi:hypothetical protein